MVDPGKTKAVIARNLRRLREKRGLSGDPWRDSPRRARLLCGKIQAGRILPDIGLIWRLAAVFEVSCIAFLRAAAARRKGAGSKPSR